MWSGTLREGRTLAVSSVTQELQVEERDLFTQGIFSSEEGGDLPLYSLGAGRQPTAVARMMVGEANGDSVTGYSFNRWGTVNIV